MNFTQKDKAVLIGLVLGDGYISKENKIEISHSVKQEEYCIYKAKLLHSIFGGKEVKVKSRIVKYSYYNDYKEKIIKHSDVVRIRKGSTALKEWREKIYPNGKKKLSLEILQLMDTTSLMLWWLDDGNLDRRKSGSGHECISLRWSLFVSKEEINIVQKYLQDTWNVNWNIRTDKRSPNLYWLSCGKQEGEKFLSLFRDTVLKQIPSMSYKVLFSDTSAEHSEKSEDIV